MSKDLSELLKEATKEVHEQAENTPFMKNFQKGQVSLHEFKVLGSSIALGWDFLAGKYAARSDRAAWGLKWGGGGRRKEGGALHYSCQGSASPLQYTLSIRLQHPKISPTPLAEGVVGLCIRGQAARLKQDEKTKRLMGLIQLLFSS